MKIHIMTDLEGPSGVNGKSDGIGNKIENTATACDMLVQEVNATVEGLVRAGADDIVVWDGHGGSNSIDIGKLHPAASLGTIGGPLFPVTRMDRSYTACVQLGKHALQNVADGYMNHSWNSHAHVYCKLNGRLIGEIGMEILLGAYFGLPTILVSGDEAACREAREWTDGRIDTVATKTGLARYTVINRHPQKVRADLTAAAEKALREVQQFPVATLPAAFVLEICFMSPNLADGYEMRGAERIDGTTIRLHSDDLVDLIAQRCGWAPGLYHKKFSGSGAVI